MRQLRRSHYPVRMEMTPLIDVVFQLIIFFMLVNDIVGQEAVEMIVPQLTQPKTREVGEMDSRVVINVAPAAFSRADRRGDNVLNTDGSAMFVQIGSERFDVSNLSGMTTFLQEYKAKNPEGQVLLRADSAIHYNNVQPVMAAITAAGINRINLVAFMPDKGPDDLPQ